MSITSAQARMNATKRWQKTKGIKLAFYIRPVGKTHQATGIFGGKEYNVIGESNKEVLSNLFKVLSKEI